MDHIDSQASFERSPNTNDKIKSFILDFLTIKFPISLIEEKYVRTNRILTSLIAALLPVVTAIARGPLAEIIDRLVPDRDLKETLKREIETKLVEHAGLIASAQREVVLAELTHGSRLQRLWRPLLMYLIMAILAVYGLLLPLVEAAAGGPVAFEPRWAAIPEGLWTLLTLVLGGYIGGRTVEKIALARTGSTAEPAPSPKRDRR